MANGREDLRMLRELLMRVGAVPRERLTERGASLGGSARKFGAHLS